MNDGVVVAAGMIVDVFLIENSSCAKHKKPKKQEREEEEEEG